MVYITQRRNQFVNKFLTGVGITLNQQRRSYKQWFGRSPLLFTLKESERQQYNY
jgi:hypothetical protein